MIAWVCFQCPAHGMGGDVEVNRLDAVHHLGTHYLAGPASTTLVNPRTSHRWSTIHGGHPRLKKRNPCRLQEHLDAMKGEE